MLERLAVVPVVVAVLPGKGEFTHVLPLGVSDKHAVFARLGANPMTVTCPIATLSASRQKPARTLAGSGKIGRAHV